MGAAIEIRNLSIASPQGRPMLRDISLALEEGTTTAVLGRSGSGKSTLLRSVNRLVEAANGDVLVRGKSVHDCDVIALRRSMGYVIQETGLFPHFDVERNVGLALEVAGRPREERSRRSHELLSMVGLDPDEFAQRFPHQLSGGQRQRVGLARAFAGEPEILLMDEPFGALDPLTRAEMQDMLRELLTRPKRTVVLVTHDLNEALYLGDRIVLLSEGRLVAHLDPADFMRSRHPEIEAYVKAFRRDERNGSARGRA
jgi:osmoprotectant transport system ATP-binding protein